MYASANRIYIDAAMQVLDAGEREILGLAYGLDGEELGIGDIAHRLKTTRYMVGVSLQTALGKLKNKILSRPNGGQPV